MIRFMRLEEPEVPADVMVNVNINVDPTPTAPPTSSGKTPKLNFKLLWEYTKTAAVPVLMIIVIILCLRNPVPEPAPVAESSASASQRHNEIYHSLKPLPPLPEVPALNRKLVFPPMHPRQKFQLRNSSPVPVPAPNKFSSPQLYLFGGMDHGGFTSSASHYNSSSGQWRSTTSMDDAKAHFCGVSISRKIYLFGGAHRQTGGGQGGPRLTTAEVFDVETETYKPYTSLPSGRASCGAAVLNGYIYVAGGYDGQQAMSSVVRYNIQTSQVETITPMRTARNSLQLVALDGYLYAVGGFNKDYAEKYNPATGKWSTIPAPRNDYYDFGAAVHEGKIYVCGHDGFEVYDPKSNQWTELAEENDNVGKTLVSMNGKLWALGGRSHDSVHTFDTKTGKWSLEPDMNTFRKYHTSFVVSH